jgi:hypothetical protein
MVEPVTVAIIAASIAGVGTAHTIGRAAAGDSGFNVGDCSIHYPKEFPQEQLMQVGQSVQWDIVKFIGDNWWAEHELTISATGYLGNDDGDLYGYPTSATPNVPVNRFIILNLTQSGTSENLSSGLLNCSIEPWGGGDAHAEGTADDPWVAMHVHGRWDPAGIGDMQFSFKLGVNTKGSIYIDNATFNGVHGPADDFDIGPGTSEFLEKWRACNYQCSPADNYVLVDMR